MIECTEKKILKGKHKVKKRFILFFTISLFIVLPVVYSKYCVSATVSEVCCKKVYALSSKTVNEAVLQSTINDSDYSDLVIVEKNDKGEITLITTDSLKLNSLGNEIVKNTILLLDAELKKGIPVPLLAFSGIKILSGYGREVFFKTIAVSAVKCDFCGEFRSVGINQTLHSIYAEIVSEVSLTLPLCKKNNVFKTKVLLTESVLVGKVPEIYFSNGAIK